MRTKSDLIEKHLPGFWNLCQDVVLKAKILLEHSLPTNEVTAKNKSLSKGIFVS